MSGCCHKDKGWKHVEISIGADETTVPCEGLYNTRLHNDGEVSLFLGKLEVAPGTCMPLGLDWLPCAKNIDIRFADENGTKRAFLTGVQVINYCCEE